MIAYTRAELTPYARFVVERLAELWLIDAGPDDVLSHIVLSWAADHAEYLASGGITIAAFHESSAGGA